MKENAHKTHGDIPVTLLLFAVFALCILGTLLSGAGAYRRLTEGDSAAYTRRTGGGYVAAKLRSAKNGESIEVLTAPVGDVLCIKEELEGEEYASYLYCMDGTLREVYTLCGSELPFGAGQVLMEAESLSADVTDSLATVTLRFADGQDVTVRCALRKGADA